MYKRQSTSGVFTNSSDRYSILAARDWLEFSFTTFSKHFSSRPDWECSFYLLCTQHEISHESNNSNESLYIRFSGVLPAFFLHNTEMIYIISHFGSDCEPVFPLWESRPETAHLLTMSSECKSVIINTTGTSKELPNKPKQVTQIIESTKSNSKMWHFNPQK